MGSEAAVRLTTDTFEAMQKDPTIGRAEPLRRAMLAMIEDTSAPWNGGRAVKTAIATLPISSVTSCFAVGRSGG